MYHNSITFRRAHSVCLVLLGALAAAAAPPPVADVPYLQESGRQWPIAEGASALAATVGEVYVGTAAGLQRLVDGDLQPVVDAPAGAVRGLFAVGDTLLLVTHETSFLKTVEGWSRLDVHPVVDACAFRGDVVVASTQQLWRIAGAGLEPLAPGATCPGQIQALAVYADTLYGIGYDRLFYHDAEGFHTDEKSVVEFGSLASKDLRDIAQVGNRLTVATHYGLSEVRGKAAHGVFGSEGLPWEECHHLAPGVNGDYFIGTSKGLIRGLADGSFHYFLGKRWLPGDVVKGVAVVPRDEPAAGLQPFSVYAATDSGLARIDYDVWTLRKKADYYEKHLHAWNQKRMAFTHKLEWDGPTETWMREVSDNDVGWSTHWWAAQAFRYAVTGEEQARQDAVDGFNALKWSEEITSIDGFPARSIWADGETGHRATGGSGGYPAEWHLTEDGQWAWKGDTSSDETDAQYYYADLFYRLVADDAQQEQVRDHLRRMTDHIIDNGYVLMDVDDKPTVWGRWDEAYFNSPKGAYAKGLNGLEVLGYLRTAHKITGAPRFEEALYDRLSRGYAERVVDQKLVVLPRFVNHSDDRLAFYVYYTLLQHEDDPELRALYLRSLERSWAIERIEHNPWFNFIYGAVTGQPCEAEEAVDHLRAWPLDLVNYSFDFEHRRDLYPPDGYIPYADGEKPISPRERGGYRWSDNPMRLKGGGGGHSVVDPAGWLDAYWMGRYHGFIAAPSDAVAAVKGWVEAAEIEGQPGAVPYDGPPMPNVLD
jgi:hypothetical protein